MTMMFFSEVIFTGHLKFGDTAHLVKSHIGCDGEDIFNVGFQGWSIFVVNSFSFVILLFSLDSWVL